MKLLTLPAIAIAGLTALPASAAEITGGYIDLGYSGFTDSNFGSKFYIAGSGELAFTRNFGLQLDLANYNLDQANTSAQAATLHANFHTGESLSLGAFYGSERINSSAQFYGLEAGYEISARTGIEGYVLRREVSPSEDGTMAGAKIVGSITDRVSLNANVDYIEGLANTSLTNVSIGADYDFGRGAKIYGTVGNANADAFGVSGNEPFVGLGFRFDIGAKRGTTFGRRGVLDKIPGL